MITPGEYKNFVRGEWQEVVAKVYDEYEKMLKRESEPWTLTTC